MTKKEFHLTRENSDNEDIINTYIYIRWKLTNNAGQVLERNREQMFQIYMEW